MPTLQEYGALAPFSLDELVDAVNSVLRERPHLQVSKRTARYYVQVGVLPPPQGSPKYARYSMDHLIRLVGARVLVDRGATLQAAIQDLNVFGAEGMDRAVSEVQRLVDRGTGQPPRFFGAPVNLSAAPVVHEAKSRLMLESAPLNVDHVRRIPLTGAVTLEVSGSSDLRRELEDAALALEKMLNSPDAS
jgi:DNA-binding transcriptional MerR regulator